MRKFTLFFSLLSTLVAHAATLQDPTYTSACYTSVYPGISELNFINNQGLAVGEQMSNSRNIPSYVVTYDAHTGGIQTLNYNVPTPTNGTRLTGINDVGTYVSYSSVPSSAAISGFVSSVNTPYSSPTPFNVPGAVSTFPYSINDAGVIVGSYISSVDRGEHGFISHPDGTFQTLDNPGATTTRLVGINNAGQIVGVNNPLLSPYYATSGFLYSGGSFVQLTYGAPVGINDSGAIAMTVDRDAIAMHVPNPDPREDAGILYPNGTLALLYGTDPFSPQSPEAVNGLAAINNEDMIIFDSAHAFVGTPVAPEPALVGLLAIGVLGLVSLRIRRRHSQ